MFSKCLVNIGVPVSHADVQEGGLAGVEVVGAGQAVRAAHHLQQRHKWELRSCVMVRSVQLRSCVMVRSVQLRSCVTVRSVQL